MTADELRKVMPYAGKRADVFAEPLTQAMAEFEINTPARQAAFLAQLAHESGSLRYVLEIASGAAYEGRKDLGNVEPGDGVAYKGRGLIQITGRANYRLCGQALGLPLEENPALLEEPINACRSAAWYWRSRGLNELADRSDFLTLSVRINGRNRSTGLPNGWDDRLAHWEKAKEALA